MTTLYTATATAIGGRGGRAKTSDGTFDLPLSMPKSLGGDGAHATNPEQLFAAGYAACFGSALGLVASQKKIKTGPVQITAHVSLDKNGPAFELSVKLVGHLPEVSREDALSLMNAAHEVCPYSRATRNNISVSLDVE